MTLAIRATGVALGERELSHAELAASHGVSEEIIAATLEGMIVYAAATNRIALARAAVQRCLDNAGITIDGVDLLIACRSRVSRAEPPLELALGRPRLPRLTIKGASPILLRAIWLARAWLRSEQERRVLVVYAETCSSSRRSIGELTAETAPDIFSDGAAAVLVEDGPGFALRSFAAIESAEWWTNVGDPSPVTQLNEPRAQRDSMTVSSDAFARCLEQAGATRDDVAAVVMANEADAVMRFVMRQLRMPYERLFRAPRLPSRTWAVDPIFNLEQLVAAGKLSPGDLVICGARAVGGAAFLALEVPGASR